MTVGPATADDVRRWRLAAVDRLAEAVAAVDSAVDASVPAYPQWTVRDLACHVVRIQRLAAIAVRSGVRERPSPDLGVTRDDEPAALAAAVRAASREAETALADSAHGVVWTPVGERDPAFWRRRLLRESVLHRWDAEQAGGAAGAIEPPVALELIAEFVDTDLPRALAGGEPRRVGSVALRSGPERWHVDLEVGSVTAGRDGDAAATVSGEPAGVWLWLMRRDAPPGTVAIDDPDGSAAVFANLLDQLSRPSR